MKNTNKRLILFVIIFVWGVAISPLSTAKAQPLDSIEDVKEDDLLSADIEMKPATAQDLVSLEEPTTGELDSQYTLGENDVLEVTVLRHPEVSGEYIINSEGKIQYEFVGDIDLNGLTKDKAAEKIRERLETYIIAPEVTVKIKGYNSKIVYVIGEVAHPGIVYMRGDTITVRQALIAAGLPLLSAKGSKSRLITPSEKDEPEIKKVNIDKLLYEGNLKENLVMKPGDTLYIPATIMTKTMRVLKPVAEPIGTAAGTGRTVMTGF